MELLNKIWTYCWINPNRNLFETLFSKNIVYIWKYSFNQEH